MTVKLGAIADDFTGATDLALLIRNAGYSVVQTIGIPDPGVTLPETDAIVVALKSRTNPAKEAVQQSLEAYRYLSRHQVEQYYFKYCSTFDSTPRGNIGPVVDALLEQTASAIAVACPAFPDNGRTVYKGHLFVHQQLLSESPLRNHPLTPMTDANLVRVLSAQSNHDVGLADVDDVESGAEYLGRRLGQSIDDDKRLVIVDAINNNQLDVIGEAVYDHKLVTGGSALAGSLVRARLARESKTDNRGLSDDVAIPEGGNVVLAGSCSEATLGQIAHAADLMLSLKLDIDAIANGEFDAGKVVSWAKANLQAGPVLIYASESIAEREGRQHGFSPGQLGVAIESAFSELVPDLVTAGVRRFVVAGGETSGAVVSSLGVQYLHIAEQIDPGVPWTVTDGDHPVALALKSGNFGGRDFFTKAFSRLADPVR